MTHAVIVKHIATDGSVRPEILAHDIQSEDQAQHLVSTLAASYPEHGLYVDRGTEWFRDASGEHEIWAQPI